MDTVDTATRSRIMAGIRSRSKLEVLARKYLEHKFGMIPGYSYLVYQPTSDQIDGLIFNPKRGHHLAPFSPDYYVRYERAVVYVNGCFWHGCSKHFKLPKSRTEFWKEKIERNQTQQSVAQVFWEKQRGYPFVVVWECEVTEFLNRRRAVRRSEVERE